MTTAPLGSGSITGSRLAGSAIGRLRWRHVLGSGTATLCRSTGTAAVPRVPRATTLLPALRLPGTSTSALLGTRAASLALLTLGTGRSARTPGNTVVPATARGLGCIRIGLDAARHCDLELLGRKLNASSATLAMAAPRGLLLALRTCGVARIDTGTRALLGAAGSITTIAHAPATTLGLHKEVCVVKALGRRHAVRAVKLGQGHTHVGRL